ncbi:MAG: TonB-dependent receptor [Gammaproteobacteria bacterium]|nr:TonB-dependent receptor [Gammaproteobacteria bacterium]
MVMAKRVQLAFLMALPLALMTTVDAGAEETNGTEVAMLEEIVVTARKREESLQETPISITAFSAASLEAANMVDLRDIGKYTPGMSFTSYGMGSSEAGAIFLRGIGQSDHMVTTDPGVGLYIDGVYVGRNQGAALDLLDLERVEVLRGPQGTLYGKNTIGGAVNVISRKPTGTPGGHVSLTVGQDGRFNGAITGETPLGDQSALSFGFLSKNRDGVGEQVFTGAEAGDEDSLSGRAQFSWQGQAIEFSLAADATRARQAAMPHSFYAHADWLGVGTCYQRAADGFALCGAGTGADPFDSYSLDNLDTEQDLFGLSATLEWDVSENLVLKSISAYRDMEYLGSLEFDGAPQRVVYYRETGASDQFSQELQLTGTTDASLTWIAGLYYFTEEGHNDQQDYEFGGRTNRVSQVETSSYAAFGQATMDIGPRLSVTGGLRYTEESKDYHVLRSNLDASGAMTIDDAGQPSYAIPPTAIDETWNAVSGTLNVNYALAEGVMVYGTYSRGFRSGGFAARPAAPASVGAYDPEYVDMFEIGLKALVLDDRLRFNAAVYRNDYEDYQAQVNRVGNSFDTRVLNAAAAEIDGVELELTALISPIFRIDATYAYTDAEITKVDLDPSLEANFSAGHKLPYVSENTFSISPQLDVPLASGGSVLARLDYAYRDDFYGQIANSPFEREKGYGLINGRIEYRSAADNWSVALYGINLADETYTRVRNYYPGFLGFAIWNTDRREIGLTGRYEF